MEGEKIFEIREQNHQTEKRRPCPPGFSLMI
jgi:hypothetical protein